MGGSLFLATKNTEKMDPLNNAIFVVQVHLDIDTEMLVQNAKTILQNLFKSWWQPGQSMVSKFGHKM